MPKSVNPASVFCLNLLCRFTDLIAITPLKMTSQVIKMPKKLIVFCDGTWNTPDEKDESGNPCPTNVSKLFRATAAVDALGHPQIVHYVQGLGTHRDDKIWGGVFGMGISQNILDGYQFICSNYEPDDRIYLFGFSRGAYTARSLAGLIYNMGILKREHFDQMTAAYQGYVNRAEEWHPTRNVRGNRGVHAQKFRRDYSWGNERIHFLGVWDTVGALGVPYGLLLGFISSQIFKCRFHDTELTPIIEHAYHAVSKAEKRWPFRPTLFDLPVGHDTNKFDEQWFDGVHADVGGGYTDSRLSDTTLDWMTEKASQHGLVTHLGALPPHEYPSPSQAPHASQTSYYRWSTLLLVKWPALLLVDWPGKQFKQWPDIFYRALNQYNIIAEPDIRQKISKIDCRSGDFLR